MPKWGILHMLMIVQIIVRMNELAVILLLNNFKVDSSHNDTVLTSSVTHNRYLLLGLCDNQSLFRVLSTYCTSIVRIDTNRFSVNLGRCSFHCQSGLGVVCFAVYTLSCTFYCLRWELLVQMPTVEEFWKVRKSGGLKRYIL